MASVDTQLEALKEFANAENKELVSTLEEILDDIAKTGQYTFQWNFLKPLFAHKLDKVTKEFLADNPPILNDGSTDESTLEDLKKFRAMLLETFDRFMCAPFTIQRVSELLLHPGKHYKSTAKLFRGLEKNILVVSTVEPVTLEQKLILKRTYDEKDKNNKKADADMKPPVKKSAETNILENESKDDKSSVENNLLCKEETVENHDVADVKQTEMKTQESVIKNNTDSTEVQPNNNLKEQSKTIDINEIKTTDVNKITTEVSKENSSNKTSESKTDDPEQKLPSSSEDTDVEMEDISKATKDSNENAKNNVIDAKNMVIDDKNNVIDAKNNVTDNKVTVEVAISNKTTEIVKMDDNVNDPKVVTENKIIENVNNVKKSEAKVVETSLDDSKDMSREVKAKVEKPSSE